MTDKNLKIVTDNLATLDNVIEIAILASKVKKGESILQVKYKNSTGKHTLQTEIPKENDDFTAESYLKALQTKIVDYTYNGLLN